jgi:uncharacterized protein with PIN domain
MNPGDIRFSADAMLQSLAKWLRLLGYDCASGGELHGLKLVEQAVAERRWVLSRNRRFAAELPHFLLLHADIALIASGRLPAQLREVVQRFSLEPAAFRFTRCLLCNEPLVQVPKPGQGVAPEVLEREDQFWRCPHCGRFFWKGSHVRRSIEKLNQWLTL